MRLVLAAMLLAQWAWPQPPQTTQSGAAQLQSIAKQWQAVEAQRIAAERHRSQTVPQAATSPSQVLTSGLICDPLPPSRLEPMIQTASNRHGIGSALVKAVVRQESGGSPCAISPKGAIGLMQLMPATAASLGVGDPLDPEANLDGGVRFLKGLLDRYQGDYAMALGAYNAGPTRVDRAGQVPAIAETQAYVRNVLRHAGFPSISSEMPEMP